MADLEVVEIVRGVIEVVDQGPQGIPGDGGLPTPTTPGQIIKVQDDLSVAWVDDEPGTDAPLENIRGGTAPVAFDEAVDYAVGNRVTYQSREYIALQPSLAGAFVPENWQEVSIQKNEERIANLEENALVPIVTVERLTETVAPRGIWTSTAITFGTQVEFLANNNLVFDFNGIKLLKGIDVFWESLTTVSISYRSVQNEDYLRITETTAPTGGAQPNPTEINFSQTVAPNQPWTISGIDLGADNNNYVSNKKLTIYFNGAKLNKGTSAVWISPTELSIPYRSVATEDNLTVRLDI